MRQFIKEHPWRLEIVPVVITLAAAILPLLHRSTSSLDIWQQQKMPENQLWALHYIDGLLGVIFAWIPLVVTNHAWALREREKRFNYAVTWWPALMISLCLLSLGNLGGLTPTLAAAGLLLWIAEIALEYTRPHVKKDEAPIPVPHVHLAKSEAFFYRETKRNWSHFSVWGIFALWMGQSTWVSTEKWWLGVAVVVVQLVAASAFPTVTLTVSQERVTVRHGLEKVTIGLRDIASCSVEEFDPGSKWYGPRTWVDAVSRLWIWTTGGKTYHFEPKDPHLACALINAAIASNSQSEVVI